MAKTNPKDMLYRPKMHDGQKWSTIAAGGLMTDDETIEYRGDDLSDMIDRIDELDVSDRELEDKYIRLALEVGVALRQNLNNMPHNMFIALIDTGDAVVTEGWYDEPNKRGAI